MGALRRAFLGIAEHRLLAVACAFAIAVVLTLVGAFVLVAGNLSAVLNHWGKDVQISCYLRPGLSDEAIFALKAELTALPEVRSVQYVSADEALSVFAESIEGLDRILADLDGNPLPASLEVQLIAEQQRPDQVEAMAKRIRRPEFEDLDWSREWVERFHTFVGLMRLSTLGLGVLLLLAGVFIVHNTVRLAIHARRDELAIVALVGGTRAFARTPFLLEGALLGLAGGALAVAVLLVLHRWAFSALQGSMGLLLGPEALAFLPPDGVLAVLVAGVCVGLIGATASVLRTDAEDLS